VVGLLVAFACGEEAAKEEVKPVLKKVSESDLEDVDTQSLEAEARVIPSAPKHVPFPSNGLPMYPVYHGPAQFAGASVGAGGPGVLHPKGQEEKEKSSYAVIPDQPGQADTLRPRFVENPAQNQIIETVNPVELQQLQGMPVQPHPMAMHPQAVQFPHQFAPGHPGHPGPYMMMPFNQQRPETATVRYEETEHSFMDRVWAVRRSTTDFIGSIPSMFRDFWQYLVGTVTATSRMLIGASDDESDLVDTSRSSFTTGFYDMISSATSRMYNIDMWDQLTSLSDSLLSYVDPGTMDLITDTTARMVKSIDWYQAINSLVEQLS